MPTATEYRTIVAHRLNAFTMTTFGDYPTTGAVVGGKAGFSNDAIDDAVQMAAAAIINAIASIPGHPLRAELEAAVAHTNGALLAPHVGPIGAVIVDNKPGRLDSADAVQRERDNPMFSGLNSELYGFRGKRLYFTGTTCTVDLVQITEPVDPAEVPASAAEAVIDKALASLFAFDGGKIEAAAHFDRLAEEEYQKIGIASAMPETPAYTPA